MSAAATGPLDGVIAERVGRWASRWTDTGLWDEVLLLANRVWAAPSSSDQALAWHHLLLAVGNFKRQGGRRIRPAIELPALAPVELTDTLVTPTGVLIDVDAVASWEALSDSITGSPHQHARHCWRRCGPTDTSSSTGACVLSPPGSFARTVGLRAHRSRR